MVSTINCVQLEDGIEVLLTGGTDKKVKVFSTAKGTNFFTLKHEIDVDAAPRSLDYLNGKVLIGL